MSQRVILLGGVAAVFLLMVSAQANASCKACNLAHRDCRTAAQMAYKLCKADCRLDFAGERDGRRACFETCQIPRSDVRGACHADRASCNDTCSNAANPACPGACTGPYRECSRNVRDGRKDCMGDCRTTNSAERQTCRDTASADRETCKGLDDPGECLETVGIAQSACLDAIGAAQSGCLDGCATSAEGGIAACAAVLEECVTACPPEEPEGP